MRVEVYAPGGRELIGYYPVPKPRDLHRRGVHVIPIPDDKDDFPSFLGTSSLTIRPQRNVALTIQARHVAVDEMDIRSTSWRAIHDIPDFAEESKDAMRHQRVYSWPVLVAPDAAIAEIVFDLDALEPVGQRCGAVAQDEYWWETYEGRGAALHSGGFVNGKAFSSALTANAITADKLADAVSGIKVHTTLSASAKPGEVAYCGGRLYRHDGGAWQTGMTIAGAI